MYVPLVAQCLRPQVSEERPGGNPGLGLQSARTLKSLAESEHEGIISALSALLTPGGMAVLRRSPEEMIRVLRSSVVLETPSLIWGPKCRDELEELLKQVRSCGLACLASFSMGSALGLQLRPRLWGQKYL